MIVAVFLRGINTGGLSLKMADFKAALSEAGCTRAVTIQAAGTAVCDCGSAELPADGAGSSSDIASLPALKADIESRLARIVGQPVHALLRTETDIVRIAARMAGDLSPETHHDYVFLVDDPAVFPAVAALHADIPFQPGERLEDGGDWFRWSIARGDTLGEFGGKVLGSRKFRDRLTSRNYRTVQKVLDEMRRMAR